MRPQHLPQGRAPGLTKLGERLPSIPTVREVSKHFQIPKPSPARGGQLWLYDAKKVTK